MTPRLSRRRVAIWLLVPVLIAGAGFGAGWTVHRLSQPSIDSASLDAPTLVTVTETDIGRSQRTTAVGEFDVIVEIGLRQEATITRLDAAAVVRPVEGEVLLWRDLRPVVIIEGNTPLFRTLESGAVGDDVLAVQEFLVREGYTVEADGRFGATTTRALTDWRRDIGAPLQPAAVAPDDFVIMASLPDVLVRADVVEGSVVTADDVLFSAIDLEPVLRLLIPQNSDQLPPRGTPVAVTSPSGDVRGFVVGDLIEAQDGSRSLILVGDELAGRCDWLGCDDAQLSESAGTVLEASIEWAPPTTGPALPVSALRFRPNGDVYVTLEDSTERDVEVEAQDRGMAIVSGLEPGTNVISDHLVRAP